MPPTIVIGAGQNPSLNGSVLSDPLRWGVANPGTHREYVLDITAVLADMDTALASVAVSVSPSGPGELEAVSVEAAGGVITVVLTGGVRGRNYAVQIDAEPSDGDRLEFAIGLLISPDLARFPLSPALCPDFGCFVTWMAGGSMLGPLKRLPEATVIATGTTQFGGTPLSLANTKVSGGAGGGVVLPDASTFCGAEMMVSNRSGGQITAYPYGSNAIEDNGPGTGIPLQDKQNARFRVDQSGLLLMS